MSPAPAEIEADWLEVLLEIQRELEAEGVADSLALIAIWEHAASWFHRLFGGKS